MAEAIFRDKTDQLEVKSAGVYALPGSAASAGAKQVLQEKGIDFDHRAQSLSRQLMEWADVILTMTQSHKQYALQMFPEAGGKVYTLTEFVSAGEDTKDISDPFGGSVDIYRLTAVEIEEKIDKLLEMKTNN